MDDFNHIIAQQAVDALQRLGMPDTALADEVAASVLSQAVYWEKPLADRTKVLFVRLFSPVVQREEVFLGNILFNAFLGKAFARAVAASGLGQAEPVANDLESYYFLVRTGADAPTLAEAFRAEVERSLPDLFFGEPDEARGIYGSLETMLEFGKANVEPFPVFIMPQTYAERLEKAARTSLLRKIEGSTFGRNPTSIMANLAFFYSHDGAEMQSPYLFLARLALRYGIISQDQLRHTLVLDDKHTFVDESAAKTTVENALKRKEGGTFSPSHLRELLKQAVLNLGEQADANPDEWRMSYIHSKFLPCDEKTLTAALLVGVTVGYTSVETLSQVSGVGCRICGVQLTVAEEKSILMGQNTHKFHNQSSKQHDKEEPKTCLRCAACAYLMVKLIGSEAVGQPQVPKTYNLVFHYGRHTDDEVAQLVKQFDLVWGLVQKHRELDHIRGEAARLCKELIKKAERERDAQKKLALEAEIAQKTAEVQQAEAALSAVEAEFDPWLAERPDLSRRPYENCTLDVLANLQLAETQTERHILGLGMGGYRMILFVLPQIRPPRDKEHDFAQRRFSNSRVTVLTFLSFLRQLCGCAGPFYYQSLPTLTPDAFNPDTFYVRDEPISAAEVQTRYEVVTQLAWRLIGERGSSGFVKKVVLAEKLLHDPLGTFAAVMRDSPILGVRLDKKRQYKPLPEASKWREDWGKTQDLTEYAKFIQRLSKI
jgi:hypothetical protein